MAMERDQDGAFMVQPKRYGLGATPVTWEGWASRRLTVGFIVGVACT